MPSPDPHARRQPQVEPPAPVWAELPEVTIHEPEEGAAAWEDRVRLAGGAFEGTWSELETAVRTGDVDPRSLPVGPLAARVRDVLSGAEAPPGGPSLEAWLLVAVAQLARWKAQRLFPETPDQPADEGEDGGGEDLVRHLLRYERYRELADALAERAQRESRRFPALLPDSLPWNEAELALDGLDLAALGQAFAAVLAASRAEEPRLEFAAEPITVAQRLSEVTEMLAAARGPVLFEDLFRPALGIRHAVVTFLALLELAHQQRIRLRQESSMGPIQVSWLGGKSSGVEGA